MLASFQNSRLSLLHDSSLARKQAILLPNMLTCSSDDMLASCQDGGLSLLYDSRLARKQAWQSVSKPTD